MELFRKRIINIYNTIDCHQYKRAVSLCNQLLTTFRDNPLILSLKALSLYYDGQKAEGLALCEKVANMKPADIPTLRALTEVFQAENKDESMTNLYTKAWETNSNDEELGNQFFMMLVGLKDFANQQKISIDLNKKFPKRTYLFWSIISIMLRAQFTDSQQANILYYPLAERMLTKAIYEKDEKGNVQNFEEFYLYYTVFERQNKTEKILELLNSSAAKNSNIEPHILNLKLETLTKLEQWDEIHQIGKEHLVKERDSWNIYLPFIESVIRLSEKNGQDAQGDPITIESTLKFFASLEQPKNQDGAAKLKRGPYLAQLELIRRTDLSQLSPIVEKYFNVFSSKPSCYDDLIPYLSQLANQKLEWLKQWTVDNVKQINDKLSQDASKAEKVKLTLSLVTIRKIQRGVDSFNITEVDWKTWETIIGSLIKEYQTALPLGSELLSTDKQYGDDLLLLAVHYGLDLYYNNYLNPQSTPYALLPNLTYFLEFGISKSPSNYHFKFLLTRLYQLMGCYTPYQPLLKSLDIKQIQLDTLSHTWIHQTNFLGNWKNIELEKNQCSHIYRSNNKETFDMIRLCFKNGTYSKIPEFIKFHSRLDRSIQSRLNLIELIRGSWFNVMNARWSKASTEYFLDLDHWLSQTDLSNLDDLSDNRDFKIFPDFKFKNDASDQHTWDVELSTSIFPIRNQQWLQLQAKVILIFHSWYQAFNTSPSGIQWADEHFKEIDDLSKLITSLGSTNIAQSDLLLGSLIILLSKYTQSNANYQELNDQLKALFQSQWDALNRLNNWEIGRKLYIIYNAIEAIGTCLAFVHFSQPAGAKAAKGTTKGASKPTPWVSHIKKGIDTWSQKLNDLLGQFKLVPVTDASLQKDLETFDLPIDKKLINHLNTYLNQNWKSNVKNFKVKLTCLI